MVVVSVVNFGITTNKEQKQGCIFRSMSRSLLFLKTVNKVFSLGLREDFKVGQKTLVGLRVVISFPIANEEKRVYVADDSRYKDRNTIVGRILVSKVLFRESPKGNKDERIG